MGSFSALRNCNIMYYIEKMACNGHYICINLSLHFAYLEHNFQELFSKNIFVVNSCFRLLILIETVYIQVCYMLKVKVTVQFAATKIVYTPQKDQVEMLLSSFFILSVNISDKPKKWGSIFFSHENPKENKMIQLFNASIHPKL